MPTLRRSIGSGESALTRYGLRLGTLVERHMSNAALIAARQEAEREAEKARKARREIEAANASLREEMAIRQRAQSRLAYLATHDPLTAMANRTLFNDRFSFDIDDARGRGRKLALIYIDLDNFKDVNDTLGHAAGDLLLQQVSARIQSELRPGETAARMGGDEFAVLQRDPANAAETRARVERLIALLGEPFAINDRSIFITASIGITLFPDDADDEELLHRNADLAMYRAKIEGRNRCRFFDKALNDELHRRSFLEQALREPSITSQFSIVFQPQVEMRTRRMTGVEALLRWNHPDGKVLGPDEFVPILERSGMIVEVGAWVLRESCRQATRWRQVSALPLTVAVNV
ncbi:MAG TPA: diguanylate cyclase, partial [Roseiarcus sp.]|nr:diguanylate cyclase [Roseiarcus sp.]